MKCRKQYGLLIGVLIFGSLLIFSCQYDPKTMIPMTPEEICNYMNQNFEGDFELIDEVYTDNDEAKANTAYMKCSLFLGETVETTHGYYHTIFGWRKIFETDYNHLYYKKDVEKVYGELIENWFGDYEYKMTFSVESTVPSSEIQKFSSFKEYLASRPFIKYKIVLNTSDATVKEYAKIKAKSVAYDIRNKRDYRINLYLYLWEDENSFNNLSDSDLNELSFSNEYYYREACTENYSE